MDIKTNLQGGYVPPQGYTPPVSKPTPQDMFVVAPSLDTENLSLEGFKDYMQDYAELDRVAKLIKEKQEAIKEVVLKGIKKLGMDSVKNEYGTFTVVPKSVGTTFDSKAFKEDAPKIYNMYLKDTSKKEYLKVTPKKQK